ncbi:MAG: AAC(3) family N-acetyltransferase [Lachnospiraceae bacterium]|nr:AAC(3) family N-acetyltransferase [Lachnospiraceae bacterium]MCM1237841.1 AAC(3) family N-acetyltransferase [Lachnospiraceae bacterium]
MIAHYTRENIIEALQKVGIKQGDSVFIHSNLGFLGILQNCKTKEQLCEEFIGAVKTVIGDDGTIVTPTFSYSFCHGEIYDPVETGSTCGMLSEYMIHNYAYNRSLDPNFSICGVGQEMPYYRDCNVHEAFGKDSFWERFVKKDGKVLCVNFDAGSTLIHYVEKINHVTYRYNKAFNGIKIIDGKQIHDYAVHFVYDYDKPEDSYNPSRIDALCKEQGIVKSAYLGKGNILTFSTKEYVDYISELLKEYPRILTMVE